MPLGQELLVALTTLHSGAVTLPKGHLEAGETPPEAALRETREETGLSARIVAPLQEVRYQFHSRERRARVSKRVAFFLMAYRAGSPRDHDGEVASVLLVPLAAAEGRLTHEGERRVLAEARALVGGAR